MTADPPRLDSRSAVSLRICLHLDKPISKSWNSQILVLFIYRNLFVMSAISSASQLPKIGGRVYQRVRTGRLCFLSLVQTAALKTRRNAVRVLVRFVLTSLIAMAGLSLPMRAQDAGGRIIGNVTDPAGAGIAGARVTVTNVASQVKVEKVSGEDGYFQVLALPIGTYDVTIEKPGFAVAAFRHQTLQINQSLRIDARLEIGAQAQSVEVTDQADVVETVNPTLGASVTGRTVTDMPLNGRNVLNLALLQPGVTPGNDLDSGSGQGFNIAGGRGDSVTFLLDGGLNNENLGNGVVFNPNPDTIAEFRILENNYTAEYGRNGGGIITEVVKSGTNEWHGSAFDYIRNGDFNANSFFNKNDPNNLLP